MGFHINLKELVAASEGQATYEGSLHHRKTGGRVESGYKERWFKLRYNILFYYDLTDLGNISKNEPSGAIILENCSASVKLMAETPFMFTITFNDEKERKHLFSARSEANVAKWIDHLNSASYESLRGQLKVLQNRITFLTNKDPLLMFHRYDSAAEVSVAPETKSDCKNEKIRKKSTFRSYVKNQPSTDLLFLDEYFGNTLSAIGSTVPNSTLDESKEKDEAVVARTRPQPIRKAPDPPERPLRGQKHPPNLPNLIDL